MNVDTQSECVRTSFGTHFRRLRLALGTKQSAMSASGLHCTDAAISHWERGKRLPSARMIPRVLDAFLELGATSIEIDGLRAAWMTERSARRAIVFPLREPASPPRMR